jgi:SAM-dependent methyltransferase
MRSFSLRILFFWKSVFDFFRTVFCYYGNREFRRADLALLFSYFGVNPYRISRKFLEERGEVEVYAYGETPLASMDKIARECGISSKDTVIELGCGRARTCFWLALVLKAKVIGIDFIPDFIKKGEAVRKKYGIQRLQLKCADFLKEDFKKGTVVYLHGTCMTDGEIVLLSDKLTRMKKGTKVITVSFPLTDYPLADKWELQKQFRASFTWGSTDVYLQILK